MADVEANVSGSRIPLTDFPEEAVTMALGVVCAVAEAAMKQAGRPVVQFAARYGETDMTILVRKDDVPTQTNKEPVPSGTNSPSDQTT